MNKSKLILSCLFVLFVACLSLGSVFATDNSNSTDTLKVIDDEQDALSIPENDVALSQSGDADNLTVSESDANETLSLSSDSSKEVLASSVSVSSGHTFKKCGYTFKVSDSQYKKIKNAISAGKKQKFLDWGFEFKVKTNKVIKVKVLVKTKTYHKKVRYEGLTYYPYKAVKLANLKYYYKHGWKKYDTGFQSSNGKSKKYLGYNYVKLKKTVKTYKTVKMRVYATIYYEGEYDYVAGPHVYYPVVNFDAMKKGYSSRYLNCALLK
ncbi:hypothetical protein [Methanobrevibacter sp.]|uniref:hypothetical protein n=1 Tax=Methanobrevibacter sp. TaxID=66852 RepID=UPI00388E1928